ncbi:MAG: helix-turn-helix transcriptional regulator [Bacteroidota bacterium]|nr:helix-turn-helix transcriptional regulator [Bacteroidota bacterium]
MQTDFDINKVIKQGKIQNELDFERALIADRKLRILSKENPDYVPVRKKLRDLIEDWEIKHWSADLEIADEKISESDLVGSIAEIERQFIEKRKNLIRARLKSLDLSQQALGILLGHNSKSYISELLNGITPFSLRDLIVINRLLKIDLTDLIPAFLSHNERIRIKASLEKLENTKLKLSKADFTMV